MKFEIQKAKLDNVGADTLVVFVSKKTEKKDKKNGKNGGRTAVIEGLSRALTPKLEAAADEGVLTGANAEAVFFRDAQIAGARHILAIGLGDAKALDHEVIRQAAATALGSLKANKVRSVAVALDTVPHNDMTADQLTQAITEGFLLANYSFQDFKEKKADSKEGVERITLITGLKSKSYGNGVERGMIISESVNFVRRLGDRPGNRMTPTMLAEETEKVAKGTKLDVEVWGPKRIKDEKMGSFLSVAMGSSEEPRFIIMKYNGAGKSKKPICFVGKGLTFDSGGISIKPSQGMEEMKFDMCGGAAVIGTMLAIARLKLKVNAIAFVPATENMPGPAATKPGDIVTARNGKTIEVNNTDAEGRLILADALVWASEKDPQWIVDAATLTGAMGIALGNLHTGYYCKNDKLVQKITTASEGSGEWVWRLPLVDFHAKDMRGTYADLSNTGAKGREAGSATAAAFLEQFVGKDIPWAHFDIAGTAWHTGDRLPYCPRKGASGVMVRTFVQLAKDSE